MRFGIALVLAGVLTVALGACVTEGENGVSSHIGGDKVNPAECPYTVKLRFRNSLGDGEIRYCGGARLNTRWIITAAECLDTEKYDQVQVTYPTDYVGKGYAVDVLAFTYNKGYHVHPRYNKATKANNIGLISCISCAPPPAGAVLPVLPTNLDGHSFGWEYGTVAGWTINDPTAENQTENSVRSFSSGIMNHFLCKLLYFFDSVTKEHFCVSTYYGNRLSPAHVGVPFVGRDLLDRTGPHKVIGIASPVQPWTTKIPIPIVFTNIIPHNNWIREKIAL